MTTQEIEEVGTRKRWKVEFYEYGGYDCMTAAYLIKRDDHVVFVLDVGHWSVCSDAAHSRNPEVEALANRIVRLLNLDES